MRYERRAMLGLSAMFLAACSGDKKADGSNASSGAAVPAPAPTGAPLNPEPGGKVITVEMETDAQGNNIFEPSNFEAERGDVIRYILVAGVHNANFLPDSNPGKTRLPPLGPLLQLPGQTYDVMVALEPGKYYFHCDPHALLGMMGHLTVVP